MKGPEIWLTPQSLASQGFASFPSFLTIPDHPFQGVAPNCPFLDAPSLLTLKPKAELPLNLAHSSHPGQTSCTHTQNHNPSSIFFFFFLSPELGNIPKNDSISSLEGATAPKMASSDRAKNSTQKVTQVQSRQMTSSGR